MKKFILVFLIYFSITGLVFAESKFEIARNELLHEFSKLKLKKASVLTGEDLHKLNLNREFKEIINYLDSEYTFNECNFLAKVSENRIFLNDPESESIENYIYQASFEINYLDILKVDFSDFKSFNQSKIQYIAFMTEASKNQVKVNSKIFNSSDHSLVSSKEYSNNAAPLFIKKDISDAQISQFLDKLDQLVILASENPKCNKNFKNKNIVKPKSDELSNEFKRASENIKNSNGKNGNNRQEDTASKNDKTELGKTSTRNNNSKKSNSSNVSNKSETSNNNKRDEEREYFANKCIESWKNDGLVYKKASDALNSAYRYSTKNPKKAKKYLEETNKLLYSGKFDGNKVVYKTMTCIDLTTITTKMIEERNNWRWIAQSNMECGKGLLETYRKENIINSLRDKHSKKFARRSSIPYKSLEYYEKYNNSANQIYDEHNELDDIYKKNIKLCKQHSEAQKWYEKQIKNNIRNMKLIIKTMESNVKDYKKIANSRIGFASPENSLIPKKRTYISRGLPMYFSEKVKIPLSYGPDTASYFDLTLTSTLDSKYVDIKLNVINKEYCDLMFNGFFAENGRAVKYLDLGSGTKVKSGYRLEVKNQVMLNTIQKNDKLEFVIESYFFNCQ